MHSARSRRPSAPLSPWFPRGVALLHDPELNKGTAFGNEALFFRIVTENPDEMMPIIYTPTVGLACQKFGHIFQRPRGIFVTARERGQVKSLLRDWRHRNVAMIVVTEGEQGHAGIDRPVDLFAHVRSCMYDPVYPTYA